MDTCLAGHDCDGNAECISIESDSHICVCNDGFRGSGKACRDVNECKEGSHDCDQDITIFSNLSPGYTCISTTTTNVITSPQTTDFRGDEFDTIDNGGSPGDDVKDDDATGDDVAIETILSCYHCVTTSTTVAYNSTTTTTAVHTFL